MKLKHFFVGVVTIIVCFGLLIGATAVFKRDLILTGSNAVWLDARTYTDFDDVVTALSSNVRTLVIPNEITISSTTTIPATTSIIFLKEGAFVDDANNADLTIQGSIFAPMGRNPFSGWGVGSGTLDWTAASGTWNNALISPTQLTTVIGGTNQIKVIDGLLSSITDADISLGDTTHGWKYLYMSGPILPVLDDNYDLGSSSKEFRNAYFGGTVYFDFGIGGTLYIADGFTAGSIDNVADYDSGANEIIVGNSSGTSDLGLTIVTGSSYSSNIFFADGEGATEEDVGRIVYDHTTDTMEFYADNTLALSLTSAGISQFNTYVDNANGNPTVSDTTLDVPGNVTESTWESVGPTDSGADNIWTGMDSITAGSDWVELKIVYSATSTNAAGNHTVAIHVRDGDSSETMATDNLVVFDGDGSNADDYDASAVGVYTIKVSLNSNLVFDIYYVSSFVTTTAIDMYVVGYGTNN